MSDKKYVIRIKSEINGEVMYIRFNRRTQSTELTYNKKHASEYTEYWIKDYYELYEHYMSNHPKDFENVNIDFLSVDSLPPSYCVVKLIYHCSNVDKPYERYISNNNYRYAYSIKDAKLFKTINEANKYGNNFSEVDRKLLGKGCWELDFIVEEIYE